MLLTLSTTHSPATDLGYLLHKSPHKPQSFDVSFGTAHVFYPEATEQRCTAALLLEVDPVALVRERKGPSGDGGALEQYVNDRPYVASSFLSVALSRVFGAALSGRSRERPELASRALPLTARLSVLPCRGGEPFLRRLFEPLGYTVTATRHVLDETVPEWGPSRYFTVTLQGDKPLSDLLSHLYVLVPVLDDDKHYWVTEDEIDKLLRHGEGWLASHPEREVITRRYLRHQRSLAREAMSRLLEGEDTGVTDAVETARDEAEATLERRVSLDEQRREAVLTALVEQGAASVVDVGCGEGKLLRALLQERRFTRITGMDVSTRALEVAAERLKLERLPDLQRQRIQLLQGSLLYRDARLSGHDAATVVEVIEHLEPSRLAAFERVLFEWARPGVVVLTTPNAEYNVRFEGLAPGAFRHKDHRFEWTRAQFESWARRQAERFGYGVRFVPVGTLDAEVGAPTQMAVFTR
ncbi:3' terminal RNA ribose 2'-O-methyltransferase Hen1 [Myxococcus sp. MISCRS1]|uniref:3' terminal RNA ribose 2'-O-methyltransferase Hen1 n=1 Tax=Myxococcus TaxID=32 RepID=UPI001CBC6627|nr:MULTISPECIES: 3' terminal RNA ribose 2'-O-methyltransferase Hen1 [unclassified Myxococcus]MBZ4400105.1 3' terminal RNA ribose 2'-O-methyltransferase Hen1 [Myxococcus sp. AS-1-15]MBZ4412400.1 3' terminal RNA ribose 2'-O-methyltransferase Hen1 [Myxococcus sp. XM-1-1-1]MCY0996161.1 3' terminal RNA ribose 2'-O-methyltransferase Hen1 [Myxococcus sp. MISCRS1]